MILSGILNQDEGKTLEFKRDLSSPRNILKTMVAFANTAGGLILIGVEDGSRKPIGVSNPLDEEERLCNLTADQIEPRLLPDIEFLSWEDKTLLAVEVFPSPLRPHFLKPLGPAGVFVRLGSTNRRADDEMIAEIRRSGTGMTFDEQPRPEFGVDAVDIQAVQELFLDQRKILKMSWKPCEFSFAPAGGGFPRWEGSSCLAKTGTRFFRTPGSNAGDSSAGTRA